MLVIEYVSLSHETTQNYSIEKYNNIIKSERSCDNLNYQSLDLKNEHDLLLHQLYCIFMMYIHTWNIHSKY